MSSVMENRAAVFTVHPQAVEVLRAGAWEAGELLGWRHEDSGACRMWVRVVVGGAEQTAWTGLEAVRLPEPASAVAPPVAQVVSAEPAIALAGVPASDPEVTAGLPLVRDGRTDRPVTARTGGRRRAPEGEEVRAAAAASSVPAPSSGRHRAPATAPSPVIGRHRKADTDLFPAVVEDASPGARGDCSGSWAVPSARSAVPAGTGSPARGWLPPADLDPELLTRPMRLGGQVPHARRPRVGSSVGA